MIDFSEFLVLRQEISLMAVFLFLLVYDIFASGRAREQLYLIACVLFGLHTLLGFIPAEADTAFGGIYMNTPMTILMKNILNMGTLLVFMQSYKWLQGSFKQGEFYVITLATLLGMYLMVSAGNFMMLYIGIETASLPLACLAAFEKYREKSAEAGAKFILMTALSSGIMMFGLSYLYGATGTMYFEDMQALIGYDPLVILGFVFLAFIPVLLSNCISESDQRKQEPCRLIVQQISLLNPTKRRPSTSRTARFLLCTPFFFFFFFFLYLLCLFFTASSL
jgi:NADH-quinone oxidoreductase subunit N